MMLHPHTLLFALAALLALAGSIATADERPNIVWILSEDNSVHYMNLYGETLAPTPAIERLASEGIVYEHAFSCAPVCSVARTTLMSGMLAPRIGFQFHRKQKLATLPDQAQLFPAYLRQAGYYTTNRAKKDYNVVEGEVWDESSNQATWRNRPTPETPFFHMQSIAISHESSLHFPAADIRNQNVDTNPADVQLAPYFPDTPTFRFTHARYLDRIRAMDVAVGKIVRELAEDKLLDNTIIFYFGDHGGVLPRSKGYLYETGLQVPLVIRVPVAWRDRLQVTAPQRRQGFVNFTDFGPTVLALAGLPTPETMDGRAFLGSGVDTAEVESRDEAFGYADRFDERYELCRSLRKGDWKYIRYYEPFLPDGLQNNYRYQQLAFAEWRERFTDGKLDEIEAAFFQAKPVEAIYDLSSDPHEVHNLADDPRHRQVLIDMRQRLRKQLKSLPDLSFYPESELIEKALPDGAAFGRTHAQEIGELIDIADLALAPEANTRTQRIAALTSDEPWKRYWGCLVASAGKDELSEPVKKLLTDRLHDECPLVRVRAAECLAIKTNLDPRPVLYDVLETSTSPSEVLITLNTVVFLRDHGTKFEFDVSMLSISAVNDEVQRRLTYLKRPSPYTRP